LAIQQHKEEDMAEFTHIEGKNVGNIKLFALSTCIWCKKARALLDELKVDYYYIYVDMLERKESETTKSEIRKWNPQCSFPTLVINDEKCITGFDEKMIRELAG
jgi:glutaredoxin-like protein NrdH